MKSIDCDVVRQAAGTLEERRPTASQAAAFIRPEYRHKKRSLTASCCYPTESVSMNLLNTPVLCYCSPWVFFFYINEFIVKFNLYPVSDFEFI